MCFSFAGVIQQLFRTVAEPEFYVQCIPRAREKANQSEEYDDSSRDSAPYALRNVDKDGAKLQEEREQDDRYDE